MAKFIVASALAAGLAYSGWAFAQGCPAHSHTVSVTQSGNTKTVRCVCDPGYVQSGGQCVKAQ